MQTLININIIKSTHTHTQYEDLAPFFFSFHNFEELQCETNGIENTFQFRSHIYTSNKS